MSLTLCFIHIHLRFVAHKETLEQIFFRVLIFFPTGDIPAMLLAYLHITFLLPEDDAAETWETSNKAFTF